MDGVIVLLLSVMAVQVGSSAQHQSGLPRTGLIRQSSVPYANHRRSWPPKSLTYDERDGESYQSGGSDGHNRLAQLKKKMSKWLKKREKNKKSEQEAKFDPDNMVIVLDAATPAFDQQFSANGSIPDDGCDSNSVRFDDGQCYLLLGREPCKDPRHWVTVDSSTYKGRCTPRLCGRDRVFVVRTGLCHDIYDTSECEGGRRLYYSPYGDTVCDCPIGEYPFPKSRDDCVPLFTQGPCPYGQVVAISPDGYHLSCMKSKCPTVYKRDKYSSNPRKQKQLVPTSDGRCHELGSDDGPCSNEADTSFLGLNILKNELSCVDITDPSSSYFFDKEENDLLDSVFDEFSPEFNLFHIYMVYQSLQHIKAENDDEYKKAPKGTYQRRQSLIRVGQMTNIALLY